VFPHPVRSFAGRRVELDRLLAHADHEVLFLLYGVGGIGKTELAYQLVHELRARPAWADATPVLINVQAGMTAARALAEALAAIGAGGAARRGGPAAEDALLQEQVDQLARALDERPYLVVIDDVHHLPDDQVAAALGYLSRHVRASRLIVASRRELRLPPDAPAPLLTTLGPLDPAAAEQMVASLAERMQVPRPAADAVMRTTHGSPFHIHRMLVRHAPDTGSLDASLDELTPVARRVLRALATAGHRPELELVRRTWQAWVDAAALDVALHELEQRFLVERKGAQLVLHDLVREALIARSAPAELLAAHDDAAALCLAAARDDDRPRLLLAVDATHHLIAAARFAEAWAQIERWHSALAAAGSEHLLVEPLQRLRSALPGRQIAIDLLIARSLVRASRFEDAAAVLARVGEPRSPAEDARYRMIAGEIAQRAGELTRAEELFTRAAAVAPDAATRFEAELRLASQETVAGQGALARDRIAAALDALGPAATPRQRARAGLAVTQSWLFDEHFERGAAEARRTRAALPATGFADLANQLALHEMLACVEADDIEHARAAAARIDESGLRGRVAALYRAIVRYADGEAVAVCDELVAAHDALGAQGDTIHAYLAGYFGAAALSEIGELGRAQALAARTAQLARRASLGAPAARSLAQQALFAAEGVMVIGAHRLADEALATGQGGARSIAKAHLAHARAYLIEGDITRALEHIAHARAAVLAADVPAALVSIDIEQTAVDLIGGNLERAVEIGERAVEYFKGRGRDFETAHARLVLAAAYIARGRRTDLLFAERVVEQARELADRGRMRSIQVGCAILSAALARRENRDRAARELLADALRSLDPERGSVYASALVAAIDGEVAARAVPGAVALLAHLGFRDTVDCYLVDQHGRRAATDHDVARERELRELFVDEIRAVIVARKGAVEIQGRPMQCALLSAMVQARGKPISPEALYKQVWGVSEYHPLQHRNALYVAINRLRSCLRDALPDREVIERASSGWRLADGVDACVALAVRKPGA
jgi:tetratricopeptide (TPR) repeat protein